MPEKKKFPSQHDTARKEGSGDMTVREAGHLGGQKVRKLIEEGEREEKGRKSA